MAVGESVQVPAMTIIIHVTLGKVFKLRKPQCPHLPALKGCCEVEGNVRNPVKVCYNLGSAIRIQVVKFNGPHDFMLDSEV